MEIRFTKDGLGHKAGQIKDIKDEKLAWAYIRKGVAVPYSKRMEQVIAQSAEERKRINFDAKYKKIVALRESLKKCVVWDDETVKKAYLEYEKLPKRIQESIFLPYLIEKVGSSLENEEDIKEFKTIRDDLKIKETNDYKDNYTEGVVYLQALGLIDIKDKNIFSLAFDKYSNYDREEVVKTANDISKNINENIIIVK